MKAKCCTIQRRLGKEQPEKYTRNIEKFPKAQKCQMPVEGMEHEKSIKYLDYQLMVEWLLQ